MIDNQPTSIFGHPKFAGRPPVDDGPGGPHDPGMQAQIDRLNSAVDRIDSDITAIKVSVGKIETHLSHIDSSMATKLWVMTGAVVVLLAVVGGFWWIAQQYLTPILQHVGK